jgi:hypothetical protein
MLINSRIQDRPLQAAAVQASMRLNLQCDPGPGEWCGRPVPAVEAAQMIIVEPFAGVAAA